MRRNTVLGLLFFLTGVCISIVLTSPTPKLAGDICEYYGITETVINHQSLNLTPYDQQQLEQVLHPEYFDLYYCYIPGIGDARFPIHFVFYSLLAIPIRLLLHLVSIDPLKTFFLFNTLLLFGGLFWILQKFVKKPTNQIILILTTLTTPLLTFLSWPGPDIYFSVLLLLSLFYLQSKQFPYAIFLTALASWHSQPIMIFTAVLGIYYAYRNITSKKPMQKLLYTGVGTLVILAFPYLYNYLYFDTLTPWTILTDQWTQTYGFGIQNASLQKFIEQLSDLNIGLFWYAPLLLVVGGYALISKARENISDMMVLLSTVLTMFFFQTNPAWHYGMPGYGPSRHILFLIPVLVYYLYRLLTERNDTKTPHQLHQLHMAMQFSRKKKLLLFAYALIQLAALKQNGLLFPNFEHSLQHSPYAKYILNNAPSLYSPTPEIFVDRTTHTDLEHLKTAVYTNGGVCKKAYVAGNDAQTLIDTCGYIPSAYAEYARTDKLYDMYINY